MMASALLDVDGAALKVTDFLPAADLFSLHAVSRGWHNLLDEHEDRIFRKYLHRDFAEGSLLRHAIAKKYHIPKKKLYMAFAKRWIMPLPRDRKDRVCIPWIRPEIRKKDKSADDGDSKEKVEHRNDAHVGGSDKKSAGDVSKSDVATDEDGDGTADDSKSSAEEDDSGLFFIGRVGDIEQSRSCVPLKMVDNADKYTQKLVFDREAMYRVPKLRRLRSSKYIHVALHQDSRTCELLMNAKQYGEEGYEDWKGDLRDAMRGSFDLTLHVINLRTCQVISLKTAVGCGTYDLCVYKRDDGDRGLIEPSYLSLDLYGVPPRYSPKHRAFTDKDFGKLEDAPWEHDDYPPIDTMSMYGELEMGYAAKEGEDMMIYAVAEDLTFDLGGQFSNIRWRESVCGFLEAIMEEKCANGELSTPARSPVVHEQPSWLQSGVILDAITQYASFEDQAGKLRLVCHQFQSSALRQLEQKMSKVKVIGFSRDYYEGGSGGGWFKATVRQGWSQDCLADKASVVDDALWLASCRCMFSHCKNKGSCPTASEPPKFSGYQVESASLNVKWARKELEENGSFSLTKTDPRDFDSPHCYEPSNVVKCSFTQRNLGIYRLCDELEKIIDEKARTGYECEDEPIPLIGQLKKEYKVSKQISSRQFIRSLFLVFAKAKVAEHNGAAKKARLASTDEVSVGFVETRITGADSDGYYRMMKIYRFYSAANEPMEIRLERRSSWMY